MTPFGQLPKSNLVVRSVVGAALIAVAAVGVLLGGVSWSACS